MRYIKKIILLLCCLTVILSLFGCGKRKKGSDSSKAESTTQQKDDLDDITLDGMASDVLEQMTLEEKIGQLFIVCTDSLDFSAETSITDEMKKNIEKYRPGGIILYSFNIDTPDQTKSFIKDMQDCSKIPMFISVDEEGGKVSRIANNKKMGTTSFPTLKTIGDTKDTSQAKKMGETIGKEISALGFNLDFAPVGDVTSSAENEEIGERSFGSDPNIVASMCVEFIKGIQKNGVSATLKHFPGQGSCTGDTHKGFVDMNIDIDTLRKNDFIPFKKGIKADVDMIMTSHVSLSNVTGNDEPSSLSKIVVSDILRDELRYDNVIITDAMNMKSITKFYDSDEAAVKAIQAGNDMILMPEDFVFAVEGIEDAIDEGQLDEKQIDDAVTRVLKIKIRRGIIPDNSDLFLQNESDD